MGLFSVIYAVIFSVAVVIYIASTIQYRRLMGEMEKVAHRSGLRLDESLQGVKRAREIHSQVGSAASKQLLNKIETVIPAFMLRFRVVVGLGVVGLILVLFEM
ncbi:hypothetical protein [Bdellovibrio bacteriovorus]|uniref:Uncharacterized protein n=1 Tax=Bdellovibrio bacteriovorus TaxID=959 RepID=A0A1Z3N8M3_BDEBC|nr:hypothetical protein [Bdellovibrio bacteriovorus]ASD63822.1 hypothetical protein B9G79_09675 [Bdellovibrio bacteriovorus]